MPPKEIYPPNKRQFKDRSALTFHICGKHPLYHWELKNRNGAVIAKSNGTYEGIQKLMHSIGIVIEKSSEAKIESPQRRIDHGQHHTSAHPLPHDERQIKSQESQTDRQRVIASYQTRSSNRIEQNKRGYRLLLRSDGNR